MEADGVVGDQEEMVRIVLPDGGAMQVLTNDVRRSGFEELMRAVYRGSGRVEDDEAKKSLLEYLVPPNLGGELLRGLDELRRELKERGWADASRTVSPRGDLVEVEELFGSFGLEKILWRTGAGRVAVRGELGLGNYSLALGLDQDYQLVDEEGGRLELSNRERVWWETILLLHLEPILCGEEVEESETGESGKSRGKRGGRRVFARRGHRRKLPPGQSYTEEQRQKALEEWGIDLRDYNARRGLTREGGTYTFVSPVDEVEGGSSEPVRVRVEGAGWRLAEWVQGLDLGVGGGAAAADLGD